ncbi:manganese/zinc/iron transport system substrate-binding protein [Bacillus ectoiniformans]|uniref:metal ABC transporter solute-binding protein, Zn/Mn family n=1 Tax=Bacillus ectoiniformans TaxID=1494429 RepID=UPI0019578B4F|nr:zinc ABC transporter substrate-binding protein [Bacillus ectoiniformans]MBM7649177.1 manganese/zinc/iron transport system substrate-binding protein [Bacillus ectoiniformans]
MKRMITIFLAVILATGLAGCTSSEDNKKKEEQLVVATTIAQIADIVKNVGGEHVKVEALMGPGTDPHLYQAAQGDIKKLTEADVIFYNGLHLEGKMNEIFKKVNEQKPTYAVAESIPKEKLKKSGDKLHDPHVWFDISLWIYAVEKVEEGLATADPAHKEEFKANSQQYIERLKKLDEYGKKQMAQIPKESRVLVTAHDAFGYFGDAYGLEVMGLQGLSTDSEYGVKDVQSLVKTLADRNIKAIFIESSISDRSINAVVQGSENRGHEVKVGGELYSDAMGEEGTETGTYEGMFKHNIDTIVNALK